MLSHTCTVAGGKNNKILVAFCESNEYLSATFYQKNPKGF